MKGLKLRKEDIEDAKYIAECFGKEINLSDDGLDKIFYMPRYLVLPR